MKLKNTSEGNFNLKSGVCEPGEVGEANFEECKVLLSSSKAEVVMDEVEETPPTPAPAPKPKPAPKPVAKKNG